MKAVERLLLAVVLVVLATSPGIATAQSSSSASFNVTSQTLNSGLGHSTSTSFIADQCLGIGPAVAGASSSASFNVVAGCVSAGQQNVCGNGVLEVNEECDDGNTTDGDCCSSACFFETTECRPPTGECDAAEFCTGSSFPCPPDMSKPAGTPCTPDANPCTLDQCDGTSTDCMHVPDNDNPACQPTFTGGKPEPGDTVIKGRSNPDCLGGKIIIFDCGPESPPICFDGNDVMLGMGTKNPDGTFMITVPPLTGGQFIYISDSCTTPPLTSDPLFVFSPAPAPLLSPSAMAMALVLLVGAGLLGMLRLRRIEGRVTRTKD